MAIADSPDPSDVHGARALEGTGEPDAPGPDAPSVTRVEPPKCPTRTRAYRRGVLVEEGFPAERISDLLEADEETVVWLDLREPDRADLQIVVLEFGLHPLAVEDALVGRQRPKLDRYETHLFATAYAVHLSEEPGELLAAEVSIFLTPRALITVRKDPGFDMDEVERRWDAGRQHLAVSGVGFLLHGLLDTIADGYFAVAQQLDDAVEALEDETIAGPGDITRRRQGFGLRKQLTRLRRLAAPTRELVAALERSGDGVVDDALRPYFRDVYDHAARVADWTEDLRDLVDSVLAFNLDEQSYSLNEVTKKLAAWAAIIAVPTAVTGFYGQNVPYPGFGHHGGFVTSSLVIVLLSGGLYMLLRRRGWL